MPRSSTRFANRFATMLTVTLLLGALPLLGGCRSGGGGGGGGAQASAPSEAPAKGVAPPADHPMAGVEMGMRPEQVRKVLGEPDSQHRYPGAIWKNFIPYYFGADSGTRVEYGYGGQGRVVFSVNRWNGQENVVRIDYDPTEDGN